MKKRIIIIFFVLGIQKFTAAQTSGQPRVSLENLMPKSPQAAQLFRVNDITVNSAKGVPDISFNLYTASVGDLKIPIALKYDATGIKYDDIPSAVGLKWSLDAGGQISRNINGQPDENYYFANQYRFSQDSMSNWNYATDSIQTFYASVAQNSFDISHDDFSYNYPGNSGYFYYRKNKWWDSKKPYIVKVESDSLYYPKKMRITDELGNIAYFGYGAEETTATIYGGDGYVSPTLPPFGRTSMYLVKLRAYTKQEATFDYDTSNHSVDYLVSQAYVKKHDPWTDLGAYNCNCGSSNFSENHIYNSFAGRVIKTITTPMEKIQFYYSYDNSFGVYKKRLDSITVKDKNDLLVKKFRLKYGKYNTVNYLRLDEIWNFSTSGDSLLVASFHYNTDGITGLDSKARDIFNYNNGASNASTLISNSDGDFTSVYTTADRSINSQYIVSGILDTIYYPTGGKTTFYYSPNQIGDFCAPGVRTDSIKYLNNDNSIASQINYSYSNMTGAYTFSGYVNNTNVNNDNYPNCPVKTFSSEIFLAPGTSPASFYYGVVETRKKGTDSSRTQLTKEIYLAEYNCYGSYSPVLLQKFYFRNNNLADTLRIETNTYKSLAVDSIGVDALYASAPVMPAQLYHLDIGWIDNSTSCNSYYNNAPGRKAILEPRSALIDSVKIKDFDQKTITQSITNVSTSTYNDKWQKVSDSKLNSKKNLDSTYYTYLHTNAGSLATALANDNLYGLVNKTTRFTNSNVQLEQSRVSFSSHSSLILPDSFLNKALSNAETYAQMISAYDTSGTITEFESKKGFYTSLIRDYNNELVIAQTSNAQLSNVAFTSFEADGKGGWTFSGSSTTHPTAPTGKRGYSLAGGNITKSGLSSGTTYFITYWKRDSSSTVTVNSGSGALLVTKNGWKLYAHTITGTTSLTISGTAYVDELRLYPAGGMMTTYTYNPLIGITTQSDPSGRISYYEYDSFGRLRHIKDEDGNILKRVDYKYQATNQQ